MNDIATLSAQPRVLRVGGAEYKIYPLTIAEFGKLQAWIDGLYPDPFAVASSQVGKGKFTVAQEQYILKVAMEAATKPKPLLGTPEADAHLTSVEGTKQVLKIAIAKGDPKFTDADADRIYETMTTADVAALFRVTNADMVVSGAATAATE